LLLLAYGLFPSAVSAADRPFIVFDGLLYAGKPDLRASGLVRLAGSGEIWRAGTSHDSVDGTAIATLLEPYRDSEGYFYFDIENWPLVESSPQVEVSPEVRQQNIEKLRRVIDVARHSAPRMHFGFYGLMPGITYWSLVNHESPTWHDAIQARYYRTWHEVNQQLDSLAPHVDVVFPSLYTFYDDPKGWESYARQTLLEARRYGKPIYPFLWPEYHNSNAALRDHEIPPDVWRAELELCAKLADGVVLWGGYQKRWNENAPWWRETQAFIQEHKSPAGLPSQ